MIIFGIITNTNLSTNNLTIANPDTNNPIVIWNKFTTDLGIEHNLSPPKLARAYALVHISIYDALLYLKSQEIHNTTVNERDVIDGAASEVLSYLFQDKNLKIKEFTSSQFIQEDNLSIVESKLSKDFRFGQFIGKQAIIYAKNDGSNAIFNNTIIPKGNCKWTGTNPIEPMAGQWKTFILTSGAEIQPPPPEACTSNKYKIQIQQVVNASHNRTIKQIEAIHFWGDKTPPTIWNNILDEHIERYNLSIIDSARALVYLNVGMYDAGVSTWYTKYKFWTQRPFQSIQNLVTEIPTPNFPGYTSGHSAFSGTASIIMDELFPKEKDYFASLADEASMSRIWGGIHLLQDIEGGLIVGIKIGNKVVEDMHQAPHPFIYK